MPIGSGRIAREGDDVLIATWANGLYLSLRAARLRLEGGQPPCARPALARPLPVEDLLANATDVGRAVVVDETRHQGGVGEAVVTALVEGGFAGPITRVAAHDSFVPLGDAANLVLVSEDDIADAVRVIRRR